MKYNKLFLSYAAEDVDLVRSLARDLTRVGVPVWFDEREVPIRLGRQEIYRVIRAAVVGSRSALFVHTPTHASRTSMMFDEDGRAGATYAFWSGLTRDKAAEVDPVLLFEHTAFEFLPNSQSKIIYAEFEAPDADNGRVLRSRSAVYEVGTTIGIRSFSGYTPADGRLIGEKVTVSFRDYERGLAAVLDELNLYPGEWMNPLPLDTETDS